MISTNNFYLNTEYNEGQSTGCFWRLTEILTYTNLERTKHSDIDLDRDRSQYNKMYR